MLILLIFRLIAAGAGRAATCGTLGDKSRLSR
jgi:hypothetical protein